MSYLVPFPILYEDYLSALLPRLAALETSEPPTPGDVFYYATYDYPVAQLLESIYLYAVQEFLKPPDEKR